MIGDQALAKPLHVRWRLLNGCNYNCRQCRENKSDNNVVLAKYRIAQMVAKLFQRSRSSWHIYLGGGEPTLHPFLADIINDIYARKGNTFVCLETNGSQSPAFYQELIKNIPMGKFQLSLAAHPGAMDLDAFIAIIQAIGGRHALHVRIFVDPAVPDKSQAVLTNLINLHQFSPFTVDIDYSMSGVISEDVAARVAVQKSVLEERLNDDARIIRFPQMKLPRLGTAGYPQGADWLLLEPDGRYSEDPFGGQWHTCPFWEELAESPFALGPKLAPAGTNERQAAYSPSGELCAGLEFSNPAPALQPKSGTGVFVTFILTGSEALTLGMTISSIIAQCAFPFEILLLTADSGIRTFVGEYARALPNVVKILALMPQEGLERCVQRAMVYALGQYIAFVNNGDILDSPIQAELLAEGVDIVAWHGTAEEGNAVIRDHRQIFIAYLNSGPVSSVRCFYRREFLLRSGLPSPWQNSLVFQLGAFSLADSVLFTREPLFWRKAAVQDMPNSPEYFRELNRFLDGVHRVAAGWQLDLASDEYLPFYNFLVQQLAAWLTFHSTILMAKDWRGIAQQLASHPGLLQKLAEVCFAAIAPGQIIWECSGSDATDFDDPDSDVSPGDVVEPNVDISVAISEQTTVETVQRVMENLASQTYQNYELLLCQPKSVENSQSIAKLAASDRRITLHWLHPAVSASQIRNCAITNARGRYIIFTDGHDFWNDDFFGHILKYGQSDDADVIVFLCCFSAPGFKDLRETVFAGDVPQREKACRMLLRSMPLTINSSIAFKTSFLRDTNLRFGPVGAAGDAPFLLATIARSRLTQEVDYVAVTRSQLLNGAATARANPPEHNDPASPLVALLYLSAILQDSLAFVPELEKQQCSLWLQDMRRLLQTSLRQVTWGTRAENLCIPAARLLRAGWPFLAALLTVGASGASDCHSTSVPAGQSQSGRPLLSIVVLAHESEDTLWMSLDALARQLPPNTEIIAVANSAVADIPLSQGEVSQLQQCPIRVVEWRENLPDQKATDGCSIPLEATLRGLRVARGKYVYCHTLGAPVPFPALLDGMAQLAASPQARLLYFTSSLPLSGPAMLDTQYVPSSIALDWCCQGKLECHTLNNKLLKRINTDLTEDSCPAVPCLLLRYLLASEVLLFMKRPIGTNAAPLPTTWMGSVRIRIQRFLHCAKAIDQMFSQHFASRGSSSLVRQLLSTLYRFIRSDLLNHIHIVAVRGGAAALEAISVPVAAVLDLLYILLQDYAALFAKSHSTPTALVMPLHSTRDNSLILYKSATNTEPTLTIVVIARNMGARMDAFMRSLLAADTDAIQILLLEDCSDADDTFARCAELAQRSPRISFWRTCEPLDESTCCNLALDAATGEYILFANEPEAVNPAALLQGVGAMNGHDAVFFETPAAPETNDPVLGLSDDPLARVILRGLGKSQLMATAFRLESIRSAGIKFGRGHLGYLKFVGDFISGCRSFEFLPCDLTNTAGGEQSASPEPAVFPGAAVENIAAVLTTAAAITDPELAHAARQQLAACVWRTDLKVDLLTALAAIGSRDSGTTLSDAGMDAMASPEFVTAMLLAYAKDFVASAGEPEADACYGGD